MKRVLCLLFVFCVAASTAAAAVRLTVVADGVRIEGVSPKSSVYVYGVSREARGTFSDVVESDATLYDDDGDAVIWWTPPTSIALRSIWIAIDLQTGAYAVGTPDGYAGTEIPLSDSNFSSRGAVGATDLALDGDVAHFLVVRPGGGAWSAAAGANVHSSRATIAVADLNRGRNALPAPASIEAGDIVVMINSFRAEYAVLRVTK
jgi:hypothetical protein